MKIVLCGAQGTGKTTICYQLCGALKLRGYHVNKLPEFARHIPRGFKINEETDGRTQVWLACKQIGAEIEGKHSYDHLILDRSIVDILAYSHMAFKKGNLKEIEMGLILEMARHWFETYDLIFWLRPDSSISLKDGFRSESKEFQIIMDEEFRDIIKSIDDRNEDKIVMINEPIHKRFEIVLEEILRRLDV